MASKKKSEDVDRRESDAGTCELFGRFDALYHQATGRRLERSGRSLETVETLLCHYDICQMEDAWAWWVREPVYGRDCADPLDYFAGDSLNDIFVLAFADEARSRLAARSQELREATSEPEGKAGCV